MQIKKLSLVIVLTCVLTAEAVYAQQPAKKPVDPKKVVVDEYLPTKYLDPNLLAIQVRRTEDRMLAVEQTNERLIKGYNDLAEKYNALRVYVEADAKRKN